MATTPYGLPAPGDAAPGSALGDLVRSLRRLAITDIATARAVAQLLGADGESGPAAARTAGPAGGTLPPPKPAMPTAPPPADGAQAARSATPARTQDIAPHRLVLRRRETPAARPVWLDDPQLAPMAPPLPAAAPPRLPPLFDPRRLRALLVALCSSRVAGDEIDTDALSDQVVQGRPIHALPRLQRPSLQHGVIVLLDHRDGMAPYRQDMADLVARARGLMPDERVRLLHIEGGLLRSRRPGGARVLDSLPRQVPVLVLTDLSLGGPLFEPGRASTGDWLAALATARRRHLRLRLLVPMARARWPRALQQDPSLLEWTRGTSVGAARRVAAGTA